MRKVKKIIINICIVLFLGVIIFSGYKIFKITEAYREEEKVHSAVKKYKPTAVTNSETNDETGDMPNNDEPDNTWSLTEKYPNAVAWITVPATKVDYPVMKCDNNDYYLNHDVDGNYAAAGSIFMDYRCESDFSSQNTIIYGHHMLNESVFGTIEYFKDKSFFNENDKAYIYLPNGTLELEIFAYMILDPATEKEIYNVNLSKYYFDYVKNNARNYRDVGASSEDRIVTLATCAYEFENARMVLLARIKN